MIKLPSMKKLLTWPWHHKIKSIIFLAIVGIIVLIVVNATKPPQLKTATVQMGNIREVVEASGRIKAKEGASLTFPASSKIVWMGVKTGDQVRKYQAIASVDKREVEKTIKKKLLDYMTTRWDFEQTNDDHEIKGRSLNSVGLSDAEKRVVEKSQFGLDQSVLDYEIATLSLEQATLISPVAGTVVDDANILVGERLSAADAATRQLKIVNLQSLYYQAEIDEADYAKMKMGMKADIKLDSMPDATLSGTIRTIGKEGLKKTGGGIQIMVEVALNTIPENLIPELTGDVEMVVTEKTNTLVVDKKFVTKKDNASTVQIMKNGKLETKTITTGLVGSKQIEITSGLSAGDEVVVVAK